MAVYHTELHRQHNACNSQCMQDVFERPIHLCITCFRHILMYLIVAFTSNRTTNWHSQMSVIKHGQVTVVFKHDLLDDFTAKLSFSSEQSLLWDEPTLTVTSKVHEDWRNEDMKPKVLGPSLICTFLNSSYFLAVSWFLCCYPGSKQTHVGV